MEILIQEVNPLDPNTNISASKISESKGWTVDTALSRCFTHPDCYFSAEVKALLVISIAARAPRPFRWLTRMASQMAESSQLFTQNQ
jgi:hypothetical protein